MLQERWKLMTKLSSLCALNFNCMIETTQHKPQQEPLSPFFKLIHTPHRSFPIHPCFCHIKHLGCNYEKLRHVTEMVRNNIL